MKDKNATCLAFVPENAAGKRLDQVLSTLFNDYSRTRLKQWIEEGRVLVDGRQWRPRDKVQGGERIALEIVVDPVGKCQAQAMPLTILYEDEHLLVVDKPAGLVVHPAAGHHDGTLQNALLHHAPELDKLPRAGIVHRLDKDTSGLLVVARSLKAHKGLVDQLQARTVKREYLALVVGKMITGGTVEAPIGRHPVNRKRFAVVEDGKEAITHYRIAERFPFHTLIKVQLETGRTHQIRVHMAYLRFPLFGDPEYGRLRLPPGASEPLIKTLRHFKRQALHAKRLSFRHPASGEMVSWESPIPEDFENLLAVLRREQGSEE
ncbi:MAG: hypothetical protein AXA67_06500 [Methylothermaceae bacteria B42]|nr:MAG: hypothetical protein AXA67_06500 [Methylothermaceae bacteria B42]